MADNAWENVATQNGTIKLSTSLYDYTEDDTGFAGDDTFDENFFDQEPSIELRNILTALRDDLFIGNLSVEYNNLFFIGLRKVLSEQTYVDWLFKTSFINVRHRPRIRGLSKYGIFDRLFKGIIDIIRVRKIIRDYNIKKI